jgi:hypothetical protein
LVATNVCYYLLIEPSMSHMCSFFAAALFVFSWIRARPLARLQDWFVVGLAGGLVGIVRQPDATIVVLPLLDGLLFSRRGLAAWLEGAAVLTAGFFAVFGLQMITWEILNGSPFRSGYLAADEVAFDWLHPQLFGVLFSPDRGAFFWHPLLLVAMAGFLPLLRRERSLTILLLFGFASQAYLVGAWSKSGPFSHAFGARMLISSLPLLSFGLSAALDWAVRHGLRRACWIGGVSLTSWNALFVLQYRLGYISMRELHTVSELTGGKLTMIVDLGRRIWGSLGL